MQTSHGSDALRRFFAAFGALACACAVGLGAYAAHAVDDPVAKGRLDVAVLYLAIHGLALCILAPRQTRRLELVVLSCWCAGALLFSGSLIGAALWNVPTTFAPFGGSLLIAAWLMQALASVRR